MNAFVREFMAAAIETPRQYFAPVVLLYRTVRNGLNRLRNRTADQ
jgi:hypothetical protein